MANETVREEVRRIAEAARAASGALAQTSAEERNAALAAMAAALRAHAAEIVAANAEDVEAARAAGTKESLVDRLMPVSYTHLDVYKRQGLPERLGTARPRSGQRPSVILRCV